MMRQIKFRAWVFGGLDEDSKPFMTNVMCLKWDFDQWIINWEEHDEWSNQSEYFLMQYIGLKDSNNKEAYHKDKIGALGYSNWVIEWYNNGWKLKQEDVENYQEIPSSFVIIGNIYENPELLKKRVK